MIRWIAVFALAGLGVASAQTPSAAEQAAFTRQAREVALRYSEMLPDFVCTELIHRSYGDSGQLRVRDILNVQLTYFQRRESYKLLVDGKPSEKPYDSLAGAISAGEFGSTLRWIFEPKSEAEFHWEKAADFHKVRASVYSYRVARAHSQYILAYGSAEERKAVVAGLRGLLYISNDDHSVLRLTVETEDVPFDFPIRRATSDINYAVAEVGGRRYLLPASAETEMFYWPNRGTERRVITVRPVTWRNSVEFRAYRKFAVDSQIDFGGDDKP